MSKRTTGLTTLITMLLVGTASAQAATRLVATFGSNTGTCTATPCRTIQHAVGQAAAGDMISIGSGTYAESVTVNKPLSFTGAGPSSTFVDASSTPSPAFTIGDVDVSLSGLHVRGGVKADSAGGIVLPAVQGGGPSAPAVTLDHVLADQSNPPNPDHWDHALGFANAAGTARLAVTDSEVDGYQGAIGVAAGAGGGSLIVTRSKIVVSPAAYDWGFDSAHHDPSGGVTSAVPVTLTDSEIDGLDAVTLKDVGATITRTMIHGIGIIGVNLINDGGGANVSVRDSVIDREHGALTDEGLWTGFEVTGSATWAQPMYPTLSFVGDTIAPHGGGRAYGIEIAEVQDVRVTIRNTAIHAAPYHSDESAFDLADYALSAWDVTNSAFTSTDGSQTPAPGSGTNLDVVPGFVAEHAGDLRLAPSSPLFDQGDPAAVTPGERDVTGAPRVQDHDCHGGARPDIGAYEAGGPSCGLQVAPSPVGIGTTPPLPVSIDTTAPMLFHVSFGYTRFAVWRADHRRAHIHYGSTLRYTVDEHSRIVGIAERIHHHGHGHQDTYTKVGTAVTDHYGPIALSEDFNGVYTSADGSANHALTPGDYRLALTATDKAGNTSSAQRVRFTIVHG